jgi:UrcA family protein
MNTVNVIEKFTASRIWALVIAAGITFSDFSLVPAMARAASVNDGAPQVIVNYADLDVSHQAGISVLYRRIESAAYRVCGSVDSMDLTEVAAAKHCTDKSISGAVASLNIPMLSSEYQAKTGHGPDTQNMEAAR